MKKMKKSTIGCLVVIGAVVLLFVVVGIINAVSKPSDTEESPTTTQPSAETEGEESLKQPLEIELMEGQSEGLIEVSARGTDTLEFIKLDITSQSDDRLNITILPGTLFEPLSASVQSMVATTEKSLMLQAHETTGSFAINTVSANMELDIPGEDDSLALSMTPASGEFMKLLNSASFQDESSRIRQFALWTITDNPKRNEYAGIDYYGTKTTPNDEQIERIRSLFDEVGIPTEDYRALQIAVYAELVDAQTRGLIEVNSCGQGSINYIEISLTSKSDDALEIAILPGTIFEPQVAGVQSMVVIAEKLLMLYPHETVGPVDLNTACANMELDAPSQSDNLILSSEAAPDDLILLLDLPDFHEEEFRIRQFAIWTITDNPKRGEYVGIGTFGIGSGPNDEEIEKIRVLFDKAGISTGKYQALS